ncbi:MAG: thermonuclease family protein [Gammaproteobacteria bacterium]
MFPQYSLEETQHEYQRNPSVAEVWQDAANANSEMVKAGKAAVYWRHCNSPTYGLVEWKGRSAGAGIWQ